ncbi:MAG: short-subunit dehydrogenase [Saprospiraceae bacterium]|jgi:short-subunit dehydrogenase
MRLKNKVIIITGSSIGIGKAMAYEMCKEGAKVVLNARNPTRLDKTFQKMKAEGHEVAAIAGDVSNMEDCQKIVDHTVQVFGQIDAVVNNAGISMEGSFDELSPEVFRKVIEINYLGSIYPTKAALPYLKQTKGSIIFIGSVAGIRGIPNHAAYSSSKMSLTAIAEALKIELKQSEVHVGLAYVGFTENDLEKTIYNKDGKIIPQPKRDFIKAEPPQKVALRIINMIHKRKFKEVFTPLGKLNAFINRFFPAVVEIILRRNYYKNKD